MRCGNELEIGKWCGSVYDVDQDNIGQCVNPQVPVDAWIAALLTLGSLPAARLTCDREVAGSSFTHCAVEDGPEQADPVHIPLLSWVLVEGRYVSNSISDTNGQTDRLKDPRRWAAAYWSISTMVLFSISDVMRESTADVEQSLGDM